MTTLKTVINDFTNTMKATQRKATFSKVAIEEIEFGDNLKLSNELVMWYRTNAPISLFVNMPGDSLHLYNPRDLLKNQEGYRSNSITKKRLPEWENNLVVIGVHSLNPVIADINIQGTPILASVHGVGKWNFKVIAPELAVFLIMLTEWADISIGKYKGEYHLKDDSVSPTVIDDFLGSLPDNIFEKQYTKDFVNFFIDSEYK